ncbi:MAG: hypothetical protein AAFY34_06365 [Pseudomonadota bacterium]
MDFNSLSEVERAAAELFFNVAVQSAFAKEDPNVRFAVAFKQKDMVGYQGSADMDAVENKVYQSDVPGGSVALEANPKDSPALSRVVMKGGRANAVVDAVIAGCKEAEYFVPFDNGELPLAEGKQVRDGAGNRLLRLVLNEDLNADHDVLVLFSWHAASDPDIILEALAWPIDKTADIKV